ncbi:MAG: toprim domain-containing protein [Alistipes indistinctus]|nr:toprim domain-containing protein [Alistipes indistinctus]
MLNKDVLLSRTNSGLEVFRHYIPGSWRVGRNFLNPLYKDTKPSCNIYMDRKSQCYRIKDFGNEDYSGDCFSFVGKLFELDCSRSQDFIRILKIIDSDLHLGLEQENGPISIPEHRTIATSAPALQVEKEIRPYQCNEKPFSKTELGFWEQYGISPQVLEHYHVKSIAEYSSQNKDGEPFTLRSAEDMPIFGYVFAKHIKLYRPYATNMRFLQGGDIGENYCFGLEQLPVRGDTLFFTSGEKDVMSLAAKGFNAICFGSETCMIPQPLVRSLSHRFKHIVLLYDADKVGIDSACRHEQELRKFGVKRLTLPLPGTKKEKDISDYFRLGHTAEEFLSLFVRFLDRIYEQTFAMLKSCEVDPIHPPAVPRTVVSIHGVPFGSQGNLFCITGGEGSGKSHYAGALIAGALSENPNSDFLGTTVTRSDAGHAVLLYDTEQSFPQLYKNISVILRRAGGGTPPQSFKGYCLSCISRRDRLQAIVQSMDKYYYQYGGIHMVVIDGIADLIRSVNDETESVELVEELYRLAGIYNTCIVCVLHLVPSGMKIRGHLGSEIGRKAAAILSVERDEKRDVCCLKTLKVRDGSPLDVPLLEFGWDKQKAMHVSLGERSPEAQQNRKQEELQALVQELYKERASYSVKELRENICQVLDIAESTSKNYIRFMREKKILINKSGSTDLIPGSID